MNGRGISAMHDAILFITMVSISGVILLPALVNNPIAEREIQREKSETADETLIVLLSMTPDEMRYILAEDLIRGALKNAPVDILSSRYGKGILQWLLGINQYHKSFGELIAEDLASQFLLSMGDKKIRANLLTAKFDERLKENISFALNKILEGEYKYNFTAKWNPIIGFPCGGKICIGDAPPQDAYVSKTFITMPFPPVIKIGNMEIHMDRNWMKEKFEEASGMKEIKKLLNKMPSTDKEWEEFKEKLAEDLNRTIEEILFTGIRNDDGKMMFPGIINISLHMIFDEIISKISNSFISSLNHLFGENGDIMNFLLKTMAAQVYAATEMNESDEFCIERMIDDLVDYFIEQIKNGMMINVNKMLNEYVSNFVDYMVEKLRLNEIKGGMKEIENMIDDWIFNRISVTRAEVSLAIWRA